MADFFDDDNSVFKKNMIAAIVLIAIFIVGGFIGYSNYKVRSSRVSIDKTTLCPSEENISRYTSILVDVTNNINHIQKEFLNKYFENLKLDLLEHEKITIFVVNNESVNNIKPKLTLCNPGNQIKSQFTENEGIILKRWEEKFNKPLSKTFDEIVTGGESDVSPIFEMIQGASINGFPTKTKDTPKRLYIISDMLHHTDGFSLYKQNPNFSDLKASPYYHHIKTNMDNAEVTLLLIYRSGFEKLQSKTLIRNFWEPYFREQGARLIEAATVEG
jgi:hypothetical protein